MKNNERTVVAITLALVFLLVSIDLINDKKVGALGWHLFVEGLLGAVALFGVFFVLKDSFRTRNELALEKMTNTLLLAQAEQWKSSVQKHIDGLSSAIDEQLNLWQLSSSEKEVALLLLKGLSLKDISDIRSTSEKTARAQSAAIYAKAGLAGRSELAAFFLEDLLQPQDMKKTNFP